LAADEAQPSPHGRLSRVSYSNFKYQGENMNRTYPHCQRPQVVTSNNRSGVVDGRARDDHSVLLLLQRLTPLDLSLNEAGQFQN
jgi:hypothetical protein